MPMEINEIIGKNLADLRKQNNLTQREVAVKLDFSDKSVSKWESGESVPSVDVLVKLAELYKVKLDYFVTETHTEEQKVEPEIKEPEKAVSRYRYSRLIISLMAILLVWVAAVCVFIFVQQTYTGVWIAFVWALVASLVMAIIFNSIWGKPKHTFLFISLLIWISLGAIFLQLVLVNVIFWQLFLLGIPLQIIVILCATLTLKNKRHDPATIRARREYQKEKALKRKEKRQAVLTQKQQQKEKKKQQEVQATQVEIEEDKTLQKQTAMEEQKEEKETISDVANENLIQDLSGPH